MSEQLQVASTWLEALRTQCGALAADILSDDVTLDDFGGGHFVGRDTLIRFADEIPPGITIDAPMHAVLEPDGRRLTVLGQVGLPGLDEVYKVRWSFLIEGGKLVSVVNSRVSYLFEVEPNPFDRRRADTWNFS